MGYNVNTLRTRCEAMIAEDQRRREQMDAKNALEYAKELREWREHKASRLADELLRLHKLAKKGEPVLFDDVKKFTGDGWGHRHANPEVLVFLEHEPSPSTTNLNTSRAQELLDFLGLLGAGVEEVSMSQLKDAGFRNLAWLRDYTTKNS